MNAFLFSAWISSCDHGHISDGCLTLIVCGETQTSCQEQFVDWILSRRSEQGPIPTKIEKINCTPILGQAIKESGDAPIDWRRVNHDAEAALVTIQDDPFRLGLWADFNELAGPSCLKTDVESFRKGLPEDLQKDLNWSKEVEFPFLISVLSPPVPPPLMEDDLENEAVAPLEPESSDSSFLVGRPHGSPDFPEMTPKETIALVMAPNAVMAAWLWRKHSTGSAFKRNQIQITSWYEAMIPEDGQAEKPEAPPATVNDQ